MILVIYVWRKQRGGVRVLTMDLHTLIKLAQAEEKADDCESRMGFANWQPF